MKNGVVQDARNDVAMLQVASCKLYAGMKHEIDRDLKHVAA